LKARSYLESNAKCEKLELTFMAQNLNLTYSVLFAATPARANNGIPLRTYESPHNSEEITLVQAICATMAAPTLFKPFSIGSGLMAQKYTGTPLGVANPIMQVMLEAESIYGPDQITSIVLSIGSGRPAVHSFEGPGDAYEKLKSVAPKILADGEILAEEIAHYFLPTSAYMRFNVSSGMEKIQKLDWDQLPNIRHHALAYIKGAEVQANIGLSTYLIRGRRGLLPIGRFGMFMTHIYEKIQSSLTIYSS
jgi:hypothetical protein